MKEEVLSKRLSVAAAFVPAGAVTADVGADHAALSLFLLQKEIAKTVVVSDVNPLPLARAKAAFEGSEYASRAVFCLADGIRPLLKHSVECFVVAGMGGETISAMLELEPSQLRGKTFVLQPMSKIEHLRRYLSQHGFLVCEEQVVLENKRPFVVMKCIYDGVVRQFSALEYLAGETNLKAPGSPAVRCYLEGLCKSLRKQIHGIRQAGERPCEQEQMLGALEKILKGEAYDPAGTVQRLE